MFRLSCTTPPIPHHPPYFIYVSSMHAAEYKKNRKKSLNHEEKKSSNISKRKSPNHTKKSPNKIIYQIKITFKWKKIKKVTKIRKNLKRIFLSLDILGKIYEKMPPKFSSSNKTFWEIFLEKVKFICKL